MPKVLACTQKMENYCVGIIAGKHQNVAYAEAYNAQNMKMAVISSKAVELNRHPSCGPLLPSRRWSRWRVT
jgi:hypothetical protein